MREHLAAGLLALMAFFGTARHGLIAAPVPFALFGAACTGLGTRLTGQIGERPLPGNDLSRVRAHVGAILARHQRRQMMIRALRQQTGTMRGARTAFALTVGTGLG